MSMKQAWEYKKLGDVCAPKNDIERASKIFEEVDEIEYIDISSIDNKNHRLLGVTPYIMEEAPSRAQQRVLLGDILISTVRPNLKNIAIVDIKYNNLVASSGFCVLRPTNVERNYLFHYITSDTFTNHLMNVATGANYPAVRDADILDTTIPVPPLPTQQSIVSELDSLSQIIADCKETLKDYDALEQSIFYDMFGDPVKNEKGWEVKKLGEISVNLDSKRIPITQSEREKGVYPYYGASGIVDYVSDYIFDGTYLLVSEDGANLLARSTPIAFTIKGKNWVNNHAHIMEFECFCTQLYIEHHINNIDISQYVTGAAQPKLTQAKLNSFNIPVPPHPLQQTFASKISAIEQMKAETKAALQEAETLFNARMDYWFN